MFYPLVNLNNLSEDKTEAFSEFLERVRNEYNEYKKQDRNEETDMNGNYIGGYNPEKWALMSISGYIKAAELDIDMPEISFNMDENELLKAFTESMAIITYNIPQLKYKAEREKRGYLSPEDKNKLNELLNKIRIIINEKVKESDKKEAMILKLNDLQKEIDTDKTRFERINKMVVDVSVTAKEVCKNVIPFIDKIMKIIRDSGNKKALPAPKEKPLLESPETESTEAISESNLDDEIPF